MLKYSGDQTKSDSSGGHTFSPALRHRGRCHTVCLSPYWAPSSQMSSHLLSHTTQPARATCCSALEGPAQYRDSGLRTAWEVGVAAQKHTPASNDIVGKGGVSQDTSLTRELSGRGGSAACVFFTVSPRPSVSMDCSELSVVGSEDME